MSSLDDHIRSVLDRIRVTLSGQLEADLTASTADILRAVADEQRQAISDAEERAAGEARLDAEQQIAGVRAGFDHERDVLQRGATEEIEGLERTLGDVRDELDVARRSLEELQGARDELGRELEQVKRNVEDSRNQLESLRAQLGQSSRLSSAFRTLNEATSLVAVLDRLAQAARQESGRTAMFLVRDDKLRGWRAFGFASDSIVGAEFDARTSDLVGEAARLGTCQYHRSGGTDLPRFATAEGPLEAVALPVQVGGSVVAVLYADTARADSPEEAEWQDMMDALVKHAGRVLEAMTVNQAAALWAPRTGAKRASHGGGERLSVGRE